KRELFIAERDGKLIGRIAAIVDENYNEYHKEKMGTWGFFECFNDHEAAKRLFNAAEEWVRLQGMEFIRGPLNPSTNYEVGLLIEGFEHFPTIMMPWNYSYYRDLIENSGYIKEKDLFTFRIHQTDPIGERVQRLGLRALNKGHVSIRNISRKSYESDIWLLAKLYNEAWADNWGFAPMSDHEIHEMARNLRRILEENLVFFLLYDGEPAGVVMVLPDMNPLLKQANGRMGLFTGIKFLLRRRFTVGLRAAMVGLKTDFKRLGAPLVMFRHLNNLFRGHKQIQFMEGGWTLENNKDINKLLVEMGAKKYSVYRIFRKSLV
ncbi:MAG: acyl-CoA N-acyltransferase, partial [Deltaproteobacteria bacterium]|nr:acyl-CoA N-acyltransferase [Deltaproteobacteria bacterium]